MMREAQLATIQIGAANVAGKMIGELRLRTNTGASIVGIQRGEENIINPGPDEELRAGDEVLLLGLSSDLRPAVLRPLSSDLCPPISVLWTYAAFFPLMIALGNGTTCASSLSSPTAGFDVSFPPMISVNAMSAASIPGGTTISGRWPRVSCRTRRETTFTSSSVEGITLEAAATRLAFIETSQTLRLAKGCHPSRPLSALRMIRSKESR
jgi:hypothetical protein